MTQHSKVSLHSIPSRSVSQKTTSKGAKKFRVNPGFWVALCSWIVALVIMSGALNETFSLADAEPSFISIQVEKGDTLWGIAQHLNETVFDHSLDIRYLIYQIEESNALDSAIIHPGQTLMVPLDL